MPALFWQSILNFPTGYAMSCQQILRALNAQRIDVAYRYVYGPGSDLFPVPEPHEGLDEVLSSIRDRDDGRQVTEVAVVYGQGDVFERNIGRIRVGFTMLEVDGFPDEWVRQASEMDEVWVPSEFNREGFLRSGLKRPISVVPLGVDPIVFSPFGPAGRDSRDDFGFVSCFEWSERKNAAMLLRAFNEEFKRSEPATLVCKVFNSDESVSIQDEVSRLNLLGSGGRINLFLNRRIPYNELPAFYRSFDCYIAASRGEGWNLPLMEAMACGLPAIATDWGGHREYIHAGIAYPLEVRGVVPAVSRCTYYKDHHWSDPDPEHLRFLMRSIYENRDEAVERGTAAAKEIRSLWTWSHTAERVILRLQGANGLLTTNASRISD